MSPYSYLGINLLAVSDLSYPKINSFFQKIQESFKEKKVNRDGR